MNLQRRKLLVLFLILFCSRVNSQFLFDTAYYKKCYDKSLWSVYQNVFSNSATLKQSYVKDTLVNTKVNLMAESMQEFGISWSKNKNYALVNLITVPVTDNKRKPKTKYINALASFSDRYYLLELSCNWYKGFYDKNSGNYLKNFNDTTPYYALPKLTALTNNIRYVYFTNYKKFSYSAAYKGTAQQKKSATSFLMYGNAYYNRWKTDSSFIAYPIRNAYQQHDYLNRIYTSGINTGIGASGTLVLFKTLFFNITAMAGPLAQLKQTSNKFESGLNNSLSLGLNTNFRYALGINFKHFYIVSTGIYETNYFKIDKVDFSTTFLTNTFSIGYRFNRKKSKFFN